jgi:hypothetical protein
MPRRTGARRTWEDITREALMFGVTQREIDAWQVGRGRWGWDYECEALASRDPGQVRA